MKNLIILFLLCILPGCITISNSGYDQAQVKQNGKALNDLVDSKADATVKDITAKDNKVSGLPGG
jgi:hypothetical protein